MNSDQAILEKENAELKKEIEALESQKQMLDLALSLASIMIRVVDANGVIQYDNASNRNIFGYADGDGIGKSTFLKVHPDDRERISKLFNDSIADPHAPDPVPAEFRLKHRQGSYLWVHSELKFILAPERPVRGIITVWDITEKKMMRDAYHDLAKKLNAAREDERAHIALRIHNEFGQSITGLKFDLSYLVKNIPTDHQKALAMTEDIMLSIDNMADLINRISSECGPSILIDYGLKTAIEWLTGYLQEKTGIEIIFKSDLNETITIDGEKALEVFRICQEALTNVARHASATIVIIYLRQEGDALSITIEDNGRGITENEIADRMSLGLRSMRARASLLGGKIEIAGQPNIGTIIQFEMLLN